MPVGNAKRIFTRGLEAVSPSAMAHRHLKRQGDMIKVGEKSYALNKNVHVIGFGKAVGGMCRAVQDILQDHIVGGIISVPTGLTESMKHAGKSYLLPIDDGKIAVHEGAKDNLPDGKSCNATLAIIELLKKMTPKEIIVTLVSGGGSALLCAPAPPLSMRDKVDVTKLLMKRGASIDELNMIRKSLSAVKGGKLAEMAYPAEMVTLILSDIIGDPLELIASGPTVKSEHCGQKCLDILQKYGLLDEVTPSCKKALLNEGQKDVSSHGLVGAATFSHVHNVLVGTNTVAVNAALFEAERLGYCSFVVSNRVEGEAKHVGSMATELGFALARLVGDYKRGDIKKLSESVSFDSYFAEVLKHPLFACRLPWFQDLHAFLRSFHETICSENFEKDLNKLCLILAGETTVTLTGNGVGGRNQEMVLAAAIQYQKLKNAMLETAENTPNFHLEFLSAGTDGQDGPTDAAGAVFHSVESKFMEDGSDFITAESALANNDSYNFLSRFPPALLKTGLTGTNVMDIQVLIIETA